MNYWYLVDSYKSSLIAAALRGTDGNRSRAARALGLEVHYLFRLIRKLRPEAPPGRLGWR
jgi:DNA-binding NtrC family response regulator